MIVSNSGMGREEVFYIVFVGRQPDIYTSQSECQQMVGYKGNVYKSYNSIDEAQRAWIFYAPQWKREEMTSMEQEDQATCHNAATGNIEIDRRMERMNDFNFITIFCMGCVATLTIRWIIPRIM